MRRGRAFRRSGCEGEAAVDISKLRQQTVLITFDPGYANTGSCRGEISHYTLLHENFARFFGALPKDAHPMPLCAAEMRWSRPQGS